LENPLGLTTNPCSDISFSLDPLKNPPVEKREGEAVSPLRAKEWQRIARFKPSETLRISFIYRRSFVPYVCVGTSRARSSFTTSRELFPQHPGE